MLRKTLTLGTVFILVLSLLVMSMITCLTYDAEANAGNHGHWHCWHDAEKKFFAGTFHTHPGDHLHCTFIPLNDEHVTGE